MYSMMLKKALEENHEGMEEIVEEIFEHMKEKDECRYWKMYFKMHEAMYGHKLTEEMAEEWVESMKPYGEHWTKEQTDSVSYKLSQPVDLIDFYAGMNMAYNDYYKAIETDEMTDDEKLKAYMKLAYYFIEDEDFGDNKMYEYYKTIVMNKSKRA
jgi:hypothetical protein